MRHFAARPATSITEWIFGQTADSQLRSILGYEGTTVWPEGYTGNLCFCYFYFVTCFNFQGQKCQIGVIIIPWLSKSLSEWRPLLLNLKLFKSIHVYVFIRWSSHGWPGFVRTIVVAPLAFWRNSGPRSSSLAWTAPSRGIPTSTSTSCRLWRMSSTSTGRMWWWQPFPHLTTGTQEKIKTKWGVLFSYLIFPLSQIRSGVSTSVSHLPFINTIIFFRVEIPQKWPQFIKSWQFDLFNVSTVWPAGFYCDL